MFEVEALEKEVAFFKTDVQLSKDWTGGENIGWLKR